MKRLLAPLLNNWFPIGVIFLALCAIPGIVLVVLALLGDDGPVNAWLLENCQITYQLTLPPWVALMMLSMPLVLVVLYFLKLKRKPMHVPSTFLWKKTIEDLRVNSLFQWLRNNILLLLQLLVLLFLIYSVLGLRHHGSSGTSRHYILLIDNSASMSVRDVAPSRLEWAKQEALKEIDAASDNDSGMVIVFNSKANTLQTYTNDKGKVREAVRGIKPTQRTTRIEEALTLAASLANPERSTEDLASQPDNVQEEQRRTMVPPRGIPTSVHLYSDGRFAPPEKALKLDLHYHQAGKIAEAGNTNNLAVVGFNALRQTLPGKKSGAGEQQLLAFVQLANFRSGMATVKLNFDILIDGVLTHPLQQMVEIPARNYKPAQGEDAEKDEPGEASVKFVLPAIEPRRNTVLHAYLDKPGDEFPLDDQAWLVVGATRKAKVLVVGPPNSILDAFFEQDGTKKYAQVEHLAPAELLAEAYAKKARSGEVDLVVFDRCAPASEADMPQANTCFIDRPPPPWRRGDTMLKNPLLIPSKQNHPLLRYLTTLLEVRTHEAFLFDASKNLDPKVAELTQLPASDPRKRVLPALARIIETTNHVPMVFTLPRGPFTDLVLAFPLLNDKGELVTDWPLQTSFPLFFRNILHILGNMDDSVRVLTVQPGEPVVLRPEAGVTELEITTPGKEIHRLTRGPRPDFQFSDTEQVGVYRYRVIPKDDLVRSFAVNLLDVNESDIEPRQGIRIGNDLVSAGQEKTQPRDIWKWILLLAVLSLLVEWFIYHRRIAV